MVIKKLLFCATIGIALTGVAANGAATTCSIKVNGGTYVADITNGKRSYLKCAACHTLPRGEKHRVGPNLGNMFNRPALGATGYKYSNAFRTKAPKWNDENLDDFLAKPSRFTPGTKMIFSGLSSQQERVNLIGYLKSATGSGGC